MKKASKNDCFTIFKQAIKEKPIMSGFPILDERLNGFWKELYIVASSSAMGKTTFLTQLAWNFVENNKNTEVLFFSLDHPRNDISIKIASQSMGIPFSYLKNIKNDNERYNRKMERKLKKLKKYFRKITIFDSKHKYNFTIDEIIDLIRKKKEDSPKKNIVVIIDQLHAISGDTEENIADKLKKAAHHFDITVILAMSLDDSVEHIRPEKKLLKSYSKIISKAYAFMIIYTDFVNNFETPFMEWDWERKNSFIPVSELMIIKNKIADYAGSIFYKFYQDISFFKECIKVENDNYSEMVKNLKEHSKKQKEKLKARTNCRPEDKE
jgi:replicative DNA helicase